MECFFCQDTGPVRGVTPCCYKPVCESCCGDDIQMCTCGKPLTHYHLPLNNLFYEPVQDQIDTYIKRKNAYLVLIKDYQWKIRTITMDAYVKELNHSANCLLKLCANYSQLVYNNIFVDPPVIPKFVPLGVCKKNDNAQWCVVSHEFDTFLEQHADKPWNLYYLSKNPNLPFQYVLDHPEKPWEWDELENPNIPLQYVLKHSEIPWDWYGLSRYASFQDFLDHPDLPWDWKGLSLNPNVPFRYVLDHPKLPWNWYNLSTHVPFQHVLDHPKLPWIYDGLSRNPNLSIQYVLKHPDKPWRWLTLSKNPNVLFQHALDHCVFRNWAQLSWNPNLPFQYVLDHPEKPWDWYGLSFNTNVSLQDVLNHPELPWKWEWLSMRVSIKDVLDHPELPWDWNGLSVNKFDLGKHIYYIKY